MEIGDNKFNDIEKRIGTIETDGATTKATWVATGRGIALMFTVAGSIGAIISWIVTHLKFK